MFLNRAILTCQLTEPMFLFFLSRNFPPRSYRKKELVHKLVHKLFVQNQEAVARMYR